MTSAEIRGSLANVQNNEFVSDMQSQIHQVISTLVSFLSNQPGDTSQSHAEMDELVKRDNILENFLAAEAGSPEAVRNRALYHLKRIYDTITQIAAGVGVP